MISFSERFIINKNTRMSDKNHEQYLEQIETAVAETTKSLLAAAEEDNQPTPKNFRKVARMVAEKQVEIDRLKEYQSNDKKTIRQLRAHFKEAVDEIECRHSTWESMEGEYQGEIEELKKARDYWSKSYHLIGEKWSKDITEAQEDATAPLEKEIKKLKEENKKFKETNEIRFDKIKEMENEVGVSKLVHHQNLGLLEDINKLKEQAKRDHEKRQEKHNHYRNGHQQEVQKLKSQITKLQASEARLEKSSVGSMLSSSIADLS